MTLRAAFTSPPLSVSAVTPWANNFSNAGKSPVAIAEKKRCRQRFTFGRIRLEARPPRIDVRACTMMQLPARFRRFFERGGDLGEFVVEDIAQKKRGPFERRQAIEHEQKSEVRRFAHCQRLLR